MFDICLQNFHEKKRDPALPPAGSQFVSGARESPGACTIIVNISCVRACAMLEVTTMTEETLHRWIEAELLSGTKPWHLHTYMRTYVIPVTHYPLPVTCYLLLVTCHLSPVTCYLLPVTCYLSPATRRPDALGFKNNSLQQSTD